MRNDLLIRHAAIKDLSKIVPLFDSYREYFGQLKNPVKAEQFLFDRFQNLQSVIFIVEQGDEAIGFAQLYPIFSSLSLQSVWLLNDFYISEGYRHKGAGKQLFAKVKEFAALTKAKSIELSVEHSNEHAWQFWEKQGFQIDKEFRYYSYLL
ncbi:ribosomal protein S18 acetylase RimI-like enzyme [Bacillus oleivorans]|uniref:Ribosomal protein S18 acetylase RimI-like enzyme n=1 Tax=Bacillus oleivorans TaxID=1448271 RepID=A0A285CTJ5_9BACI|nr:GNAT family N-acetyltransferase [Bacillus oleivorans]SNX70745.1 ribosomal protein S18 acetylase RimI-like enzyme [Bacillus oleivorans]